MTPDLLLEILDRKDVSQYLFYEPQNLNTQSDVGNNFTNSSPCSIKS